MNQSVSLKPLPTPGRLVAPVSRAVANRVQSGFIRTGRIGVLAGLLLGSFSASAAAVTGDGRSGSQEGDTFPSRSAVVVSDSGSIARTGYTITGWNSHPEGFFLALHPGNKFNIPPDTTTLYAQWAKNPTQPKSDL